MSALGTTRGLRAAVCCGVLVGWACGPANHGNDAGPPGADAGGGADAGPVDAGRADAGAADSGTDAGAADAGPHDGGCGCDSGVCLGDGGCGACLPGPTDDCPAYQYCDGNGFTCVQGCESDAGCASGMCGPSHNCVGCASDQECIAQDVCQQGTCGPPCAMPSDCSGGLTCCAPHCLNTVTDIQDCGSCGNPCGSTQFCDGMFCQAVTFSSLCTPPLITVILNGLDSDNDAGAVIANALADGGNCMPFPAVAFVSQDAGGGVVDPATGQPIAGGGQMLVAAGGPFVSRVVQYLEAQASPVYFVGTPSNVMFLLRDGGVLLDAGSATLTPTNDYVLLELVREPTNGTLTFVCYGFLGEGTAAGGRYFANVMAPALSVTAGSWILMQWTSPDGGDTYSTIAQGP